ncbi:adenylyl-sulfate reductase subunit alpha [Desulfococcus multivorans]|uniref:Adenylylsulfate reductase, alpha subunit n=2 Tax=Desulfococcus TaxID=896 RepID=S7UU91_DESML|nr:adenylyl-sulfate reductase subunit alpha [Desulfococcus multivorans]AOY59915.1 AprA: adenylylsulfate reductase, subunit alpha [Desulfococcus multivorans]AQV02068.1 adenylyl-sulfate reductase subunit alpha [Desulfococcus multivorans]EPR35913.1 adenylylsulfate reductase, alpha subunit [Desulfococcus multivorans DSM 2059]SJZ35064.1 dissimilatory adenylylsulfate reductase alpha subunit precursor [Desulfococcus multivorans DSM 2059]
MALPNKPMGELKAVRDPEVDEREVDILIVGGGMAACGAAFEIKKWAGDKKVLLCDKAAMERSGAVAQGLSAINTYIGSNTPDDYVRMVRNDLMGLVREDLIFDLGCHVDDSVHLFEEWGLPIWKKTEDGKNLDGKKGQKMGTLKSGAAPVRTGKWQIMINGESYKRIVAEAAKLALGEDNIIERCFIVELLLDANEENRIAGAVGFSVRENKVYIIKANTMMVACGGAVNIYQPRSVGEGKGRAWYPVWNAGSTYTMCMKVGAELSMMENRFTPARFKDGYGPVGAWFLLFKAKTLNGLGEAFAGSAAAKSELEKYAPYGTAAITPTCLRNHLMLFEMKEGRGPIIMDTVTALAELGKTMDKKELKHLESEAWEDFLDMTCGQANLWCATNTEPEKKNSEVMPTEPYLLGSHSGCCGLWTSGPDFDWVPEAYKIKYKGKVYNRMTTVNGLFTSGDGVGCSGHKFSSGSHAEGRMAAKAMAKFVRDNADFKPTLKQSKEELVDLVYKPVRTFLDNCNYTTAIDINPAYIKPNGMMYRLMKATHEYGAGTATFYQTSSKMLEVVMDLLQTMREDCEKLAAGDLHELMRAWEIEHRIWTVEAHLRHIQFRKETRYPGFYYQADFPGQDDENWFCFVNSKYDPAKKEWDIFKKEYIKIIPD